MSCPCCQRVKLELSYEVWRAEAFPCGYFGEDGLYRDLTTHYAGGGYSIFPTAQGMTGGDDVCLASSTPATIVEPRTGAITDTYTDRVTLADGYVALDAAPLALESTASPQIIADKEHEDWYQMQSLAEPSISNVARRTVEEPMTDTPGSGSRQEVRFTVRNLAYPVPLLLEWDEILKDYTTGDEISRSTRSVVINGNDPCEEQVIAAAGDNQRVQVQWRVYAPWQG